MPDSKKATRSTGEVPIYIGYLASFMALLAAAGFLFGMNVIYVVFLLFIVVVVVSVAFASRLMG